MLKEFNIFEGMLNNLDRRGVRIINTINPHSYCQSKKDIKFKEALLNSDVLLPDGTGIVLATKILTGKKINKIAGADIHQHLLEKAHATKQKVFYLGASKQTLRLIEARIKKEFSNIIVGSYSPSYKTEFSNQDTNAMVCAVNDFMPDYLFVGMTAPKQEKWVDANKDKIHAKIITSIGAVFDFYAGTIQRSSPFWINIGLEWLPRLLKEPKRLWKRNFISTPLFLLDLLKAKIVKLLKV